MDYNDRYRYNIIHEHQKRDRYYNFKKSFALVFESVALLVVVYIILLCMYAIGL